MRWKPCLKLKTAHEASVVSLLHYTTIKGSALIKDILKVLKLLAKVHVSCLVWNKLE